MSKNYSRDIGDLKKVETVQLIMRDGPIAYFYQARDTRNSSRHYDDPRVCDPRNSNVGLMGGRTEGRHKIVCAGEIYVAKSEPSRKRPEIDEFCKALQNEFSASGKDYLYLKVFMARVMDDFIPIHDVSIRVKKRVKEWGNDISARYPHWDFKSKTAWLWAISCDLRFDTIEDWCYARFQSGGVGAERKFHNMISDEESIIQLIDNLGSEADTFLVLRETLAGFFK